MTNEPSAIDKVRAHVEAHRTKERATFSIAGISALLAEYDRLAAFSGMAEPVTVPEGAFEVAAKIAEEDRTPGYGPHKNDMEWLAETQRREIARRIREAGASAATPPALDTGEQEAVPVAGAWRYETQYGPDGEANYAWVYHGKEMIATMRTHHAAKIVAGMNAIPAMPSKITDEMVDVIAAAFQDGFTNGNATWDETPEFHKCMFREGTRCAMAALPAIEGQGEVKVKPLEWNKHPTANLWRADNVVGLYQVAAIMFPATWTLDGIVGASASGSADGEIAAKAAAQADYERRILSALTHPVPARESENARQEAIDAFIARLDGLVRKSEEAYAAAVADFRAAFTLKQEGK